MKHMILDDEAAYTSFETTVGRRLKKTPLPYPLMRVSDIVDVARNQDVESVWIMPGSQLSGAAQPWFMEVDQAKYDVWYERDTTSDKDDEIVWADDSAGQAVMSNKIAYVSARYQRVNRYEPNVHIHWPEWAKWCEDDLGQVWELRAPADLMATIMYLEESFRTDIKISPGNAGKRLMSELSRNRLETAIDTSMLPYSSMTMDIIWSRPATSEERTMQYLHQYDKNRQYLGAAQSVELGIGTPRQTDHYEPGSVGFYHCIVTVGQSIFDGVNLPAPIQNNRSWASHDLVEAAIKLGCIVEIDQGYVWDERAHILDKWASHMWDSSAALRVPGSHKNELARQNAYRTSKLMGNAAIGRLNKEYSAELFRQDINRMIIQRARANQLYTLRKYNKLGYSPAHIYRDALYFFSDDPDIAAVRGILDGAGDQRGYKHENTYKVTPQLLAALKLPAAKGHKIIKHMKGL